MKEINMNHICKIEGHAHLTLKIDNGKVKKCELKAAEGARFFEALVRGKKVEDVQEIVSRICGICSSAHSVCCVQALEEAIRIKPSEQQKIIRELLTIGERIRSHATHLYFLTLPDYFGVESALQLSKKHQDKVNDAISLMKAGNDIIESIGGREVHPFLGIKEKIVKDEEKKLDATLESLEKSKQLIRKTIGLFQGLKYPNFERGTDYLSLWDPKEYASISGIIKSHSGLFIDNDYSKHLKENIKEYATSKFVLKEGKNFQVGAIARINNSFNCLDSETKEQLKKFSLPLRNPYHNNIAQAIELLHLANRAVKLIPRIDSEKTKPEETKVCEGTGISAVEAPRGTLFHEYRINKEGRIDYCNIITPTAQNLNMMEQDIIQLVNSLLEKKAKKEQIELDIEKLIRAYDPCFSCSTHFLKVGWG